MTSLSHEVTRLLSQVSTQATQAREAASKDDALNSLASAAELCMQALKLTKDRNARAQIGAQCEALIQEAEQLKTRDGWRPRSKNTFDSSNSGRSSTASKTTSKDAAGFPSDGLSLPTRSRSGSSALSKSPTRHGDRQIKALEAPTSTRKLPNSEQLILWKSSKLPGFNAPPWTSDPEHSDFVLDARGSAFEDSITLSLSAAQKRLLDDWRRPVHAIPPPAWVSQDETRPEPTMLAHSTMDLVQDAASDCSVVASLSAASARAERGHAPILFGNIWPKDASSHQAMISENGRYVVRLMFNGCWRKVVIDDRLPVSNGNRMLHVVDRNNPDLLWPALLEKAYLKVRGGYDFPGSSSCSDLWMFVGWIPEQIFLQDDDLVPRELWKRIFTAFQYGDVLVTVGTPRMKKQTEKDLGLESLHNYVVMDMKEETRDNETERMLLVKNPWLNGDGRKVRHQVPSIDGSSNVLSTRTQSSGSNSEQQILPRGSSWMNLESLMRNFETMFLSWNPGLFSFRQDVHFKWDVGTQTSPSGCIVDHPQFMLWVEKLGTVWLLLSRHYDDQKPMGDMASETARIDTTKPDSCSHDQSPAPQGFTSLYVYANDGQRVYVEEEYVERSQFFSTPQVLLRLECQDSRTYTVVTGQIELASKAHTFSLFSFSEVPVTLEHAASKYQHSVSAKSRWTAATSGGNLQSSRHFENPQFSLRVAARTSLHILIETPSSREFAVNAKLVHGRGKRIYSLASRDVICDTGNYRHGCAVGEVTAPVEPGMYTILCSTFEAGQQSSFALTVSATEQISLQPISREGAGRIPNTLQPTKFDPGANKIGILIRPRRLVRLNAIARFMTPSPAHITSGAPSPNSPLKISIVLRTDNVISGLECRTLAISNDGAFSDAAQGAAVRTPEIDIDPGMLSRSSGGELWLILERVPGPANNREEWCEVEFFVDLPNALEVGREWRVLED